MLGSNYMNSRTVKLGGVTVNVQPKPKTPSTVLRVDGLVDTGRGSQTVILKNALPSMWEIDIADLQIAGGNLQAVCVLPHRVMHLNCVYTGRSFGVVTDAVEAIRAVTGQARLAAIVPDVIAPGDFMVFKHTGPKMKTRFSGMLRALKGASDSNLRGRIEF